MCKEEGCEKRIKARGWCGSHYELFRKYGKPEPIRVFREGCDVDGCENKHEAHGLCKKHLYRVERNGTTNKKLFRKKRRTFIFYYSAHTRVRDKRGSASEQKCLFCGGQAEDWAYNHQEADEQLVGKVKVRNKEYMCYYSTNPYDYIPLCKKDHREFDRGVSV